MRTLLMFSGGLDSTGLLYWLLKNTDDEVIAHHVIIHTSKNMSTISKIESLTARRIVTWLKKNYRNFEFEESEFKFPNRKFIPPHLIYSYVAGLLIINGVADRIMTGRHAEDTRQISCFRFAIANNIYNAVKSYGNPVRTPGSSGISKEHEYNEIEAMWEIPFADIGKIHIIRMLPKELFDLVLFCKNPQLIDDKIINCGTCRTCIRVKDILEIKDDNTIGSDMWVDRLLKEKSGGKYLNKLPPKYMDDDIRPKHSKNMEGYVV